MQNFQNGHNNIAIPSIYTPLQVSGLASQTWRGVPAPPSRSEVCGWPDVLPPPRYHMHILEARNPYHRVIFVHLPSFFFACGGKSPRCYGFHALCIFNVLKSYHFDLTDSIIDRPDVRATVTYDRYITVIQR